MFRASPLQRGMALVEYLIDYFVRFHHSLKKEFYKWENERWQTMGANALDDVSKNNASFKGPMKKTNCISTSSWKNYK